MQDGEVMRAFRSARRLSQQDLGDLLGFSRQKISVWESGGKMHPLVNRVIRFSASQPERAEELFPELKVREVGE